MSEWEVLEKRIIHKPCSDASAYIENGVLACSLCKKVIPEELEFAAGIFGAYRNKPTYTVMDVLLSVYSKERIQELYQEPSLLDQLKKYYK